MQYPDRLIWLHQFLEIFGTDCYGVRTLPDEPRVIDGGANIGMFVLYALWRRPNARIVAVEPHPENLRYLRVNLSQVPKAKVQVVPAAFGREKGRTGLSGACSDAIRTDRTAKGDVDVIPLTELLAEPADLLKIDVEGDELAVLEGAGSGLRNVKGLVLEHHDYPGRQSALPRIQVILQEHGFDRFGVVNHRDFPDRGDSTPIHCCLLSAWRVAEDSGIGA